MDSKEGREKLEAEINSMFAEEGGNDTIQVRETGRLCRLLSTERQKNACLPRAPQHGATARWKPFDRRGRGKIYGQLAQAIVRRLGHDIGRRVDCSWHQQVCDSVGVDYQGPRAAMEDAE